MSTSEWDRLIAQMQEQDGVPVTDETCMEFWQHLDCTRAPLHEGDHRSSKGFIWRAENGELVRCIP